MIKNKNLLNQIDYKDLKESFKGEFIVSLTPTEDFEYLAYEKTKNISVQNKDGKVALLILKSKLNRAN